MTEQKITLDDTMLELAESLHAEGKMDDQSYQDVLQTFGKKTSDTPSDSKSSPLYPNI